MGKLDIQIVEATPIIIEVTEAVGQPGTPGAGTALTVKNLDGTNQVEDVNTIIFDQSTGISATDLGDKKVKVSLGSSFKTWKVAGQGSLVAEGEDELEIIAGDNVTITTNPNAPKTLTINATGGGGGGGGSIETATGSGETIDPAGYSPGTMLVNTIADLVWLNVSSLRWVLLNGGDINILTDLLNEAGIQLQNEAGITLTI